MRTAARFCIREQAEGLRLGSSAPVKIYREDAGCAEKDSSKLDLEKEVDRPRFSCFFTYVLCLLRIICM